MLQIDNKNFLFSLFKQYLYRQKSVMPNMSILRKENFLIKPFLSENDPEQKCLKKYL